MWKHQSSKCDLKEVCWTPTWHRLAPTHIRSQTQFGSPTICPLISSKTQRTRGWAESAKLKTPNGRWGGKGGLEAQRRGIARANGVFSVNPTTKAVVIVRSSGNPPVFREPMTYDLPIPTKAHNAPTPAMTLTSEPLGETDSGHGRTL
ncbi:hypothetical protein PM082_002373 [Marasmius tenuissimus]|nr:hypothetical protein PM082_002373 [Marasmius tenuissimus]